MSKQATLPSSSAAQGYSVLEPLPNPVNPAQLAPTGGGSVSPGSVPLLTGSVCPEVDEIAVSLEEAVLADVVLEFDVDEVAAVEGDGEAVEVAPVVGSTGAVVPLVALVVGCTGLELVVAAEVEPAAVLLDGPAELVGVPGTVDEAGGV